MYLIWYVGYFAKRRLVVKLSYDPTKLRKPRFQFPFLRFIPMILQLVALGFLIVAIARPQTATDHQIRFSEGIDIMILLDTSASMEAEDFKPNRLEVAKQQAVNFIEGRKADKIGIVLFAEDAFSYAPLTLDYPLLQKMIASINFSSLPKQGTAIGSAIGVGINRLEASDNPSRIMILLTDGANNRGQIDPVTAARLATEYGIKIYCIGIGKESRRNKSSSQVSELDVVTLQKIADLTQGKFYHSSDENGLKEIFDTISRLEKQEIQEEVFREVTDKYPVYIKIATALFMLSFLLMLSFIYNPLEQ